MEHRQLVTKLGLDEFDRITPRQIERCLGISKIQLHHWERLLGITPIQRSRGRGISTIYSRENLFALLLCQRLFQQVGLNLQTSAAVVRALSKHPKLEGFSVLPAVTFGIARGTKGRVPPNAVVKLKGTFGSHLVFKLGDNGTDDQTITRIRVELNDLGEKAYGPLN